MAPILNCPPLKILVSKAHDPYSCLFFTFQKCLNGIEGHSNQGFYFKPPIFLHFQKDVIFLIIIMSFCFPNSVNFHNSSFLSLHLSQNQRQQSLSHRNSVTCLFEIDRMFCFIQLGTYLAHSRQRMHDFHIILYLAQQ
jgi:hypothetical protein